MKGILVSFVTSITFGIIIPKKYIKEFRKEFGELFSIRGPKNTREINDYYYDEFENNWHVGVTISKDEKKKFKKFIKGFCSERKILYTKKNKE